jgi:hypothetical protein
MTHISATSGPLVSEVKVQPAAEAAIPALTELPSSPPTEVPAALEVSEFKKAPWPRVDVATTSEPAAKKASPRTAKPIQPVATKSSARKAASTKRVASPKKAASAKKAASPKKAVSAKKAASTKVDVRAAALPQKKMSAKKTTAKKGGTSKAKPVKAVVAPPIAEKSATSVRTVTPEAVRDDAKTKGKLVRDSFTMPQQDFGLIAVLKDRALDFKRPAKKSELLRAGLHALQQLTATQLRSALDSLAPLKAGRPKKKAN